MKPRRVIVMLELETDLTCRELRDRHYWQEAVNAIPSGRQFPRLMRLIQVQANVIRPEGKEPKAAK